MGFKGFECVVGIRGGENNRWRFVQLGDMARRLNAIHARHTNIQQDDIGFQALREAECLESVDRFTYQFMGIDFAREMLTDQTFNFSMMSIFGFVALTGVVVNSSLVLVHYINEQRAKGIALEEAVRDAGVARFRPIVLTSITTFVGLAPILRETSVSAQFLIPMATSLGFGVVFGSAISLFLVPCAYIILEDLSMFLRRNKAPAPSATRFAG